MTLNSILKEHLLVIYNFPKVILLYRFLFLKFLFYYCMFLLIKDEEHKFFVAKVNLFGLFARYQILNFLTQTQKTLI